MLKRIKEFNINGLLEKMLVDFDAHYQNRLLMGHLTVDIVDGF